MRSYLQEFDELRESLLRKRRQLVLDLHTRASLFDVFSMAVK